MSERMRKEAAGKKTKRDAKNAWAIATVQGILDNDFYIGTLRQGKYTRAKINGKEIKRNDDEHIVIETTIRPSSTTAPSPSPAPCGKSAAGTTIAA